MREFDQRGHSCMYSVLLSECVRKSMQVHTRCLLAWTFIRPWFGSVIELQVNPCGKHVYLGVLKRKNRVKRLVCVVLKINIQLKRLLCVCSQELLTSFNIIYSHAHVYLWSLEKKILLSNRFFCRGCWLVVVVFMGPYMRNTPATFCCAGQCIFGPN